MKNSLNFYIFLMTSFPILLILITSFPSHYKNLHPLVLGLTLMIMNIFSSINISLLYNSSWWSFITFLIIVGGLMIIFMYFTSFISNLMTSIKLNFFKNLFFKNLLTILFFIILFMNFNMFSIDLSYIHQFQPNKNFTNNINQNYFYSMNIMIIISIIYLLIAMFMIVKMIILNKFSLRKAN
uniref:NADH dehydrogenase subunit 6 n=1 Tax=Tassonia gloriae TaxID=3064207 RepID=UPI00286C08B4|nr:NADH dehydrogenase subunit 6 [Tassonia gloriae]WKV28895.1 NADH dehydrogenase subunit 6 [Tassonia gloriae]